MSQPIHALTVAQVLPQHVTPVFGLLREGCRAAVAWVALRQAERADLPAVLLGLAHLVSALCGLLPWGRPAAPPALPRQQAGEPESAAQPTVVLARAEPPEPPAVRRAGR
ncbi:hypothetical protein [Streptomyces sp. NPDC007205]|uniref:hypothetical protein n=1 Tax=Streptomyces sp. NPDC007205 TaxID=3154316 RepID=UPI0034068C1B